MMWWLVHGAMVFAIIVLLALLFIAVAAKSGR